MVARSVAEVVAALDEHRDAHLVNGGTDLGVEVNFGHRRPTSLVALRAVEELRHIERHGDGWRIGAGVTYHQLQGSDAARLFPGLAQAARTVGSPQIRNAGTIGGNVATASPAGDTLPVLLAMAASVELASVRGRRTVALSDFITGPKRTVRAADELIVSVWLPHLEGPQEFLKVGTRNAMVISVAAVALITDLIGRNVRIGLGSVGPTPLRAPEAEAFLSAAIDWTDPRVSTEVATRFGEMVSAASRPIDDHRSTAAYRRRAVAVCAQRAVLRAFGDGPSSSSTSENS